MTTDRTSVQETSSSRRRLSGGAILGVSGCGLLGVFMAQNTQEVTVSFLWWVFTCPVWVLALGAALLGGLVWFGVGVVRTHRRRHERREARRQDHRR